MTTDEIRSLALAAVEAANKATPAPWHHMDAQDELWGANGATMIEFSSPCFARDKAFIAQARTSLPLLAEAVLLMESMIRELRSPHDSHACERPDGTCYTCGKLAEFDAALGGIGGE